MYSRRKKRNAADKRILKKGGGSHQAVGGGGSHQAVGGGWVFSKSDIDWPEDMDSAFRLH